MVRYSRRGTFLPTNAPKWDTGFIEEELLKTKD